MSDTLPQLIVGLGNPGPKYHQTRHNAGFMVIDELVETAGPALKTYDRYSSEMIEIRLAGRVITLAKPQTLMNLSGRAVGRAHRALDIEPDQMLVVYDCLDLPLGRIRLRPSGGSGGHKGMESIIQAVGTNQIPRLRVGIASPEQSPDVVDHVLSQWTDAEQPLVRETVRAAAEAVITAVRRGVTTAMNAFNSWTPHDNPQAEQQRQEQ